VSAGTKTLVAGLVAVACSVLGVRLAFEVLSDEVVCCVVGCGAVGVLPGVPGAPKVAGFV